MDRRVALLAAAAVVASLAVAAAVGPFHADSPPTEHVADDRLFRPVEDGTAVWPYTSRERSVTGRTLALNLVVAGEPDALRRTLTDRTNRDWTGADGHVRAELSPERIRWRAARGAARYTYVRAPGGDGRWTRSAYQLQSGGYLGSRLHVRAYPAPGEWTAVQAHGEYWDWFRLRHTVTSVADAGRAVEADLRADPAVTDVRREHHGLTGGGGDGSVSVLEFAAAAGVVPAVAGLLVAGRRRFDTRYVNLPVAVAGVYLGVRTAGVVAETLAPALPTKAIVAVLYPTLVAAVPYAAVRWARPCRSTTAVTASATSDWRVGDDRRGALVAGALAATGLLLALGVDAATLAFVELPRRLVLHRLSLALALGALAAGAAAGDRRLRLVGVAGWLAGLAAPLFGVV